MPTMNHARMPMQGRREQASQPLLARPAARILAFGVDFLVIAAYIVAHSSISVVLSLTPLREEFAGLWTNPLSEQLTVFLLLALPVVLYFALLEASPRGATLGKAVLGLRVVAAGNRRLLLRRSLGRQVPTLGTGAYMPVAHRWLAGRAEAPSFAMQNVQETDT